MAAQVWIPGGRFTMGSDRHYPDEGPTRVVDVDGFWIDATPVTNADFARFVDATGHVTVSEVPPDPADYPDAIPENLVAASMTFTMPPGPVDLRNPANWWVWTAGADWRHPQGPGSSIDGLDDHPVVHVADADVRAYAAWAGVDLPTEAEWEVAARGGLEGAEFTWGDDDPQDTDAPRANTWQGRFPFENTERDGFTFTSPVGSFAPNGYGLFDMAGNVWEWTSDWYANRRDAPQPCCGAERASRDPAMPDVDIPRRVVKGGSFLCTTQYCFRYRPAARQPQPVDTGTNHVGFRCVTRP